MFVCFRFNMTVSSWRAMKYALHECCKGSRRHFSKAALYANNALCNNNNNNKNGKISIFQNESDENSFFYTFLVRMPGWTGCSIFIATDVGRSLIGVFSVALKTNPNAPRPIKLPRIRSSALITFSRSISKKTCQIWSLILTDAHFSWWRFSTYQIGCDSNHRNITMDRTHQNLFVVSGENALFNGPRVVQKSWLHLKNVNWDFITRLTRYLHRPIYLFPICNSIWCINQPPIIRWRRRFDRLLTLPCFLQTIRTWDQSRYQKSTLRRVHEACAQRWIPIFE